MFTGIIKNFGLVLSVEKSDSTMILKLKSSLFGSNQIGDSFAVNGVCLTQVSCFEDKAVFHITYESIDKTNLSFLKEGDLVHLEPALKANSSLGGHFVQGHVDEAGKLISISREMLIVEVSEKLASFLTYKGSIALDGVSLTIAKASTNSVQIAIIPHTYEQTLFKSKKEGDLINIEVDMFAKIIFKYMENINLKESHR